MNELLGHVMLAGYPLEERSIITLFVGGSALHGAKVKGYDDLDIYGCYIEPPERILGLQAIEHFVWSSGSQEEKNTADDVDLTMYSLHRWAELIMKGNPAILHYLFAGNTIVDEQSGIWRDMVVCNRERFITKKSCKQYLGFANSQRMRLTGERGMGRHGQRPDLIEKYGYDTKFAMHYIRLLFECRELLLDKHLTLPRQPIELAQLIGIRLGERPQREVLELGSKLTIECETLLAASDLPEEVDRAWLSDLISDAYLTYWSQTGQR
jgi:predicted nucleotidyltransferase